MSATSISDVESSSDAAYFTAGFRRNTLKIITFAFTVSLFGMFASGAFNDNWWEDGAVIVNPVITDALFLVMAISACCLPFAMAFFTRKQRWLLAIPLGPFFVISLSILSLMTPIKDGPGQSISSVPWDEGKILHLAVEAPPTDTIYGLYEANAAWSLTWQKVDAPLTYSEDGSFTGNERLVLQKEQGRLLVSRGGIWTDCLKIIRDGFAECPALPMALPPVEEFAGVSRARSEAIARFAGLEPTEK